MKHDITIVTLFRRHSWIPRRPRDQLANCDTRVF